MPVIVDCLSHYAEDMLKENPTGSDDPDTIRTPVSALFRGIGQIQSRKPCPLSSRCYINNIVLLIWQLARRKKSKITKHANW